MARLITKFKYLKPNARQSVGGYARYIATREGVEKIDESFKLEPASKKQEQLIQKLLHDFPDSKEMLEYEDYKSNPTKGNASEFITRTLEDNAYEVMQTKTYADYIATRPRAQRFGTHGLFTDDGVTVKLGEVSDDLNNYGGNVWTIIISLRREDAERLGFNTGERWRDMLRTQTEVLSRNFKIPMEQLKWYAAFHNESHHPHVHLMVYADEGVKPYLSKQGVMHLRSAFAKDIFAQDLLCVYEKQTEHRDDLRLQSRELVQTIVEKINSGTYDNPKVEDLLTQLADRLSKTSGKKQYGYLKPDVKALVNGIVSELAADDRIATLYDLWYQQREAGIRTYTAELPERVPLVDNPEFKTIKNAVIQEAMNIVQGDLADVEINAAPIPDEAGDAHDVAENDEPILAPVEPDSYDTPYSGGSRSSKKPSWWSEEYKQARTFLYGTKTMQPDFPQARLLMETEAAKGNGFAMHDLGRMHLSGLGCDKDEEQAQEWFRKAYQAFRAEEGTAKKKDYLQYRIGKLYAFGYGVEQSDTEAAKWYEKSVAEGNPFAAYALASQYRQGKGVAQDDGKAFALYKMAAEHEKNPNAYAAYELGRMYKDGIGTAADGSISDLWYKRAYEGFLSIERTMADDKLYYRLGQMNLNGIGTEANPAEAKGYFEKAAALENGDALYGLGKLHLKKDTQWYAPDQAVEYLIAAAQKQHQYAKYALGKLFLQGEEVPKNMDYALRWLEESVKEGNPNAEYLLGKAFLKGEEVDQDLPRAEDLLKRSSDQGNHYAKFTLGKAMLDGTLPLDIPEGIKLLTESADKGFAPAQYLLGKLLYQGECIPQDIRRAIDYLEQAAGQQNPFAAYLAGKLRLTEESIKDVFRAVRNFEIAAENGNDYAEYQLGKLYLCGKEVDRDYEKAIAYLTASAGHGNQYAAQLLHSIHTNQNWTAAMGTLRLLQHISKILQDRLEDEQKGKAGTIDRKLKRKIDEKKQAHGLKQG